MSRRYSISRGRRRAVLGGGVLALVVAGACSGPDLSKPIVQPQQLNDLCAGSACTTTGSARRTTGLTSDTIGYQLGPGAGSVLVPRAPSGLSVLVRGHGTFSVDAASSFGADHTAPSDYAWIVVDDEDAGVADVQFSVADDGSELHIADLRTTTSGLRCSVAPAGPH